MTLTVSPSPLCDGFAVCGQISLEDIAELARRGFKSIVNNRPDGEGGPGQPSSAEIEAAAKACGLAYVHFPINNPMVPPSAGLAYQEACAHLPHPIIAFCRSGARAAALFQACEGQVGSLANRA